MALPAPLGGGVGRSGNAPLAALVKCLTWPGGSFVNISDQVYFILEVCRKLALPRSFFPPGLSGRLGGEWLSVAVFICFSLLGRLHDSLRVSSTGVSSLGWAPARSGDSWMNLNKVS